MKGFRIQEPAASSILNIKEFNKQNLQTNPSRHTVEGIWRYKNLAMKNYYKCTVFNHDGRIVTTQLRLSELSLIPDMVQESKGVKIELAEMSIEKYNLTFGTSYKTKP